MVRNADHMASLYRHFFKYKLGIEVKPKFLLLYLSVPNFKQFSLKESILQYNLPNKINNASVQIIELILILKSGKKTYDCQLPLDKLHYLSTNCEGSIIGPHLCRRDWKAFLQQSLEA